MERNEAVFPYTEDSHVTSNNFFFFDNFSISCIQSMRNRPSIISVYINKIPYLTGWSAEVLAVE